MDTNQRARKVVHNGAGFARPPSVQAQRGSFAPHAPVAKPAYAPSAPSTGQASHPIYRQYLQYGRPIYGIHRRQGTSQVPVHWFAARGGIDGFMGTAPIVTDGPVLEQEVHWDAPSLTLYVGSNKVALVPALISALVIRILLFGGGKLSTSAKSWFGGSAPTKA